MTTRAGVRGVKLRGRAVRGRSPRILRVIVAALAASLALVATAGAASATTVGCADDFLRPHGTATSPDPFATSTGNCPWLFTAGTWTVSDHRYLVDSVANTVAMAYVNITGTGTGSVDAIHRGGDTPVGHGLAFNVQSSTSFWRFVVSSTAWQLVKVVANTPTIVTTGSSTGQNASHVLSCTVTTGSVACSIDGTATTSANDAGLGFNGGWGVYLGSTATPGSYAFDDFKVNAPTWVAGDDSSGVLPVAVSATVDRRDPVAGDEALFGLSRESTAMIVVLSGLTLGLVAGSRLFGSSE